MSDVVAIVVFVAAAHGGSTATAAMMTAAKQTLGPSANVALHPVEEIPPDDDAALYGDILGSDAVVEVTWPDEKFGRARIRVYARRRAVWIERDVTFSASDAEPERGRTVGYAFAAMMPDAISESVPTPPSPSETGLTPVPSPPASPLPGPRADVAPLRRTYSPFIALDLRGAALYASSASLLGGGFAARWLAARGWSFGASVDVRRGSLGSLAVADVRAAAGVGVRTALAGAVELALVVDLVVTRLSLTRGNDGSVARWIPGFALGPELHWLTTPAIGVVLAPALEIAAGQALVTVGGVPAERLPVLRWTVCAALRVRL